jgi:hypothetical protein
MKRPQTTTAPMASSVLSFMLTFRR